MKISNFDELERWIASTIKSAQQHRDEAEEARTASEYTDIDALEQARYNHGIVEILMDLRDLLKGGREEYEHKLVLRDVEDGERPLEVVIKASDVGIEVRPKGFGDCNTDDGHGTPIYVENRGGTPTVCLWNDINREDPTAVIPMDGADESKRKP